MRKIHKIYIAWLYFVRHFNRYAFLMVSLTLGFGIITAMTSLSQGMKNSVLAASRVHYGGDLHVIGFDKDHNNLMRLVHGKEIQEAIKSSSLRPLKQISRTNYFADGFLFFAGNGVRQKNVLGIDWDKEEFLLSTMDITTTSPASYKKKNSILISELTSINLKCQLGDDVILKVFTLTGQINTITLTVEGIFKDSSIFGAYKCFLDQKTLSSLLNYPNSEPSSYGYFFDSPPAQRDLYNFYDELRKRLPMAPYIASKEDLTYQLHNTDWQGIRYFLIPLSVYISQVDDLLIAMNLTSYFLYIMISLIILLSTSITYRLILKERSGEIGTMRAMGIQGVEMMEIILWESLILFLFSLIAGWLLAHGIIALVNMFDLKVIPAFDIFLNKGRLVPYFSIKTVLFNIFLLMSIILPSVIIPVYRTVSSAIIGILSDFTK